MAEASMKTWQCRKCWATLTTTGATGGARCSNLHGEVDMELIKVHWR